MATGSFLGRVGRPARQLCAAALLAVLLPDAAGAQAGARACRQLEAELASLSRGGGSPAQVKRYDAAIERQRGQIDKARGQARQAGCGFIVAGRALAFCGELSATLTRMDRNLGELQRQRAALAGSDSRRERARINAALDVNGCRAPKRTAPADGGPREQTAIGGGAGSYRTLCVRSCDGYYFPISWSVPQAAFERDSRACEAACPGTRVELHYHRVSGEDSEDMVSAATGLPYREMSNAFLYRKPGAASPAGCGCGAAAQDARGFRTIGGDYDSERPDAATAPAEEPLTAAIPLPSPRPEAAEGAATPAPREAGANAAKPSPTAGGRAARPGERQVRVVGPTFLPGPEEAIDLQAPAPARGR